MTEKIKSFITRQEMVSDTFEAFHYRDKRPREVSFHRHDFYEVYFFVDGNVSYRVDTMEFEMMPGSLVLVPPGVFHQPLVFSDRSCERLVLWVRRAYLGTVLGDTGLADCFQEKRPVLASLGRYDEIFRLMCALADVPEEKDALEELRSRALLSLLFVEIRRLSDGQSAAYPESKASGSLQKIIAAINDSFREELTLDSLADRCFLNKYYLSHLFTKEMGISVYRYILLKRLSFARELLEEGTSARDACFQSGFGDYSNFSRSYREAFGFTPGKTGKQ